VRVWQSADANISHISIELPEWMGLGTQNMYLSLWSRAPLPSLQAEAGAQETSSLKHDLRAEGNKQPDKTYYFYNIGNRPLLVEKLLSKYEWAKNTWDMDTGGQFVFAREAPAAAAAATPSPNINCASVAYDLLREALPRLFIPMRQGANAAPWLFESSKLSTAPSCLAMRPSLLIDMLEEAKRLQDQEMEKTQGATIRSQGETPVKPRDSHR
jgi:hypothetical protein